ncbi:(Fe-S)-binding protein [Chloroflexota bacterium]
MTINRKKERLHPLQILKMLPRTNCKACGEPSCYAFALALVTRDKMPSDCPDLQSETYRYTLKLLDKAFGKKLVIEKTGLAIDRERCTGCGDCVGICAKAVMVVSVPSVGIWRRTEELPPVLQVVDGTIQVVNPDPSICKQCKWCKEVCPFDAVDVLV